jgi:hypothetical protein
MKRSLLLSVAAIVVIAAGLMFLSRRTTSEPQASAPRPAPAAASKTSAVTPHALPPAPDIKVERDPATVFQRAFWRRLDATVRVLGAERREWLEGGTSVTKWEWFVALEAKPEFRRWLLEQNPFELTKKTTPTQVTGSASDAPSWFPSTEKLAQLTIYANHEGRFLVFVDDANGRLYATDRGGGFASAAKPLTP